ncbi:MAG: MerR family transcriptional regulator [Tidjanibacter sp.]|nr:MerR family transcriptional regulator [Tidjanibacter sp.]
MEEIVHPKGKIYYSMGEVCELFGVNASLLRFWESEFPILKIAKNSRGHRIYTPADVDNLRLIYHLVKEQGMTLDGAKKRLRQNREGVSHEAEIVERLRSVRNMLAALKAELGEDVAVIDVDDEEVAAEVVVVEPAVVAEPKPQEVVATESAAPAEPYVAPEPAREQLADFQMQMPSSEPQPEEPRKPRTPKMGTLIGGDLFSPEDIRLAVAKKNSKEAKKQVIEQTLF